MAFYEFVRAFVAFLTIPLALPSELLLSFSIRGFIWSRVRILATVELTRVVEVCYGLTKLAFVFIRI